MVNINYVTKLAKNITNKISGFTQMFSIRSISKAFFRWKAHNQLFLISGFICLEIFVQWLGLSFIWLHADTFSQWIDIDALALPWMVSGQILLIYIWIGIFTYRNCSETSDESFKFVQYSICFFYVVHSNFTYLAVGTDNIILGVTIVSSTIVAMVLMNRRIVLRAFTSHLLLIFLLFLVFPTNEFIPDIYTKVPVDEIHQEDYLLFWNSFYLYIGIPRTVISVIICVYLIIGIEERLKDVQYQANYDKLTKVTNRRYIMQYLFDVLFLSSSKVELEHKNQELCNALSVILLDIDFFKSVNDTYGHLSGDMVLIELARRLRGNVDKSLGWEICRYGGEEFLVVLPHCSHQKAMSFAGFLKKEICTDQYRVVDNMSISVTSSFGVATLDDDEVLKMRRDYYLTDYKKQAHQTVDSEDLQGSVSSNQEDKLIENLINQADNALYDAKRLGRNRIISANQYVDETSSHSSIELNAMQTENILQHTEIEKSYNTSANNEDLFVNEDEQELFVNEDEQELFVNEDEQELFVNEGEQELFVNEGEQELFVNEGEQELFVNQDVTK